MNHDEHHDDLSALLALDALPPDEQADAELRHGTFGSEFSEVSLALAEAASATPPADLRTATLARALSRRPRGTVSGAPQRCTSLEAFDRTVSDLAALLHDLDDEEWSVVAHAEHGTVHDLMAHLAGMERACRAWITGDGPVPGPETTHAEATRATVEELATASPAEVAAAWLDAARALALTAGREDLTRRVAFHDIESSIDGLLIMRTFELWGHAMDVAVATGRPLPTLDPERMLALSARFMKALPLALAYRGVLLPGRTARFVLTGASGGCYDVALDFRESPGEPDVTIVTDVIGLCRVAARRLTPAELAPWIEGDADLAWRVLAEADAFARD
jgi:uncharacterized protein (TIGR03083 family)